MKVLIIEDEHCIADQLERKLRQIDRNVEIVAKLDSVEAARRFFASGCEFNLIMTDIRLGDGLVFEALEMLDKGAHVVFVTAYDEYAVTAFKYNGIDYILKPPSDDDLVAALERARTLSQTESVAHRIKSLRRDNNKKYRTRFLVSPRRGEHEVIDADNIAYFIKDGFKVRMYTFDGRGVCLTESLDQLIDELDTQTFMRVNRQYILNKHAVGCVTVLLTRKLRVNVCDGVGGNPDILVSREKCSEFKAWLLDAE